MFYLLVFEPPLPKHQHLHRNDVNVQCKCVCLHWSPGHSIENWLKWDTMLLLCCIFDTCFLFVFSSSSATTWLGHCIVGDHLSVLIPSMCLVCTGERFSPIALKHLWIKIHHWGRCFIFFILLLKLKSWLFLEILFTITVWMSLLNLFDIVISY